VNNSFLRHYFDAFEQIEGWFSPDAALMFMAYHQVAAANGVSGDVLEIGVHHGLSAIALAAMRGTGTTLVAIDLFDDLQDRNLSGSGRGSRAHFDRNMQAFFGDTGFIRCLTGASSAMLPESLGDRFAFCHVDGGHSAAETCGDLELCSRILAPGALLALDDYFNPAYPGVCEGAIKFWLDHPTALRPIAIGFNKVLFQKGGGTFDINQCIQDQFPAIAHTTATLWDVPVLLFNRFSAYIDLDASLPTHLTPLSTFHMDAQLTPEFPAIQARLGGSTIHVPIRVLNRSTIPFTADESAAPFALSYHLLTHDGHDVRFDNIRSYFRPHIAPAEERVVSMTVEIPDAPGRYDLEIDIVWEGITRLKAYGVATPHVAMTVA
jgi:hypothetical protein